MADKAQIKSLVVSVKAPNASEGLPTLVASPPRPPTPPAAQVRQYSWHHYDKNKGDLYDVRREFVGANKQTNRVIPSLPSQALPVSRAHLMSVVRKVERSERSKGKLQKDSMFKGLHKSQGRNIRPTSLLFSHQKPEGISQQYSVIHDDAEYSNSEMNQLVHASQYANDKYTLKSSKARKGKKEVKFKHPGSTNDDDIECDVIEHDNDATIRDTDVNKLIARKCYAPKKHSFMHTKEFLKNTLSMCSRTFTQLAVMLAVVISILGGGLNMKLPKLICTSGLSSVECESGNNSNSAHPRVAISFLDYPILAILRKSTAAITNISKGLCSCIRKVMFSNNSKQLTRCMKVLQNTIIRRVTIFPYYYATYELATFSKNVSAGKRLVTYIFPFADIWAFQVYYLDIYTVNLELDDNFKVFYDLVYLYILTFYHLWSSCNWVTYSSDISYTLVYFSLNWIGSVIRSHNKYQSLILIGLALTRKAKLGNQLAYFIPLSIVLERVATSGDPLGMLYKRGH